MNPDFKLVFCGTPDFAADHLSYLIASDISVAAIVTQPDRPQGRGLILMPSPVKVLALEHQLVIYQPSNNSEFVSIIESIQPDLVIVIAYGRMLAKSIVDKYICVNVHASLLPKYRGASPIQAALLNGDSESGVTLMRMNEGLDKGDVLVQSQVPIVTHDHADTLSHKLIEAGKLTLLNLVKRFQAGERVESIPQDHSQATYVGKISNEDARLSELDSAEITINKIRAYTPWPGAFVEVQGLRVKIIDAVLENDKLRLVSVQPAGKKIMDYEAFVRGYHQRLLGV